MGRTFPGKTRNAQRLSEKKSKINFRELPLIQQAWVIGHDKVSQPDTD